MRATFARVASAPPWRYVPVAMSAHSPTFVSSPPSRATTVAALVLSLLVHLGVALLWAWPDLPDRPADQTKAITVDLVPAPPRRGTEKAAEAEKPNLIPQLDPAPLAQSSTPSAMAPARRVPPSRGERDLVLGQVVRHWKPPAELAAFRDAEFKVTATVLADGTLAGAFSARAPYDPSAAIEGYGALDPQDLRRLASESFYRALRKAQPLRLPPALAAKAPFEVELNFRVRDVRR